MRATLATVGDANVKAPSAVVVGAVAGLELAWFERRPLFGRTIVVTRAREQASDLRVQLESLGATVHLKPRREGRGSVVIEYSSLDELQGLVKRFKRG